MENWRSFLNEDVVLFNSAEIDRAIIESKFFSDEELLSESIGFSNLLQKIYNKIFIYATDLAHLGRGGQIKGDVKDLAQNVFMQLKGKKALFVLKGLKLITIMANLSKAVKNFDFGQLLSALRKCGVAGARLFCKLIDYLKGLVKKEPTKTIGEIAEQSPQVEKMVSRIGEEVTEAFTVVKAAFKIAQAVEDPAEFALDMVADMTSDDLELTPEPGPEPAQ